jgi:predicted Co/Zn/Cd cation transporter (cation efflux family)
MAEKFTKEQNLLKLSIVFAGIMALAGISFGIFLKSQIILFDGFFSLISVGLSALTYIMSRYIQKRDDAKFPFGKNMIEPVVIVFKLIMIGLLCIFSIVNASLDFLEGGRPVVFDIAVFYSILALSCCYGIYLYLRKQMYNLQSDLMEVEASEWYLDAMLSGAVLAGFLLAWGISFTDLSFLVPYVDPFMVMMASLYFLKVPVLGIYYSGREMLGMAPETKVRIRIMEIIRDIEGKYLIEKSYVRATKAGKVIYVDIDFVVPKHTIIDSIEIQDQIREEIFLQLKEMPFVWWQTIAFTKNEKWAK